jgi:hypothetical protein
MSAQSISHRNGMEISVTVSVRADGAKVFWAEHIALAAAVRALEGQQRKPESWAQYRKNCACEYQGQCWFRCAGCPAIPPCAEYRCPRLRGEV